MLLASLHCSNKHPCCTCQLALHTCCAHACNDSVHTLYTFTHSHAHALASSHLPRLAPKPCTHDSHTPAHAHTHTKVRTHARTLTFACTHTHTHSHIQLALELHLVCCCCGRRYIKRLKMEILAEIAFATNVYDIVTELTEYARDVVSPNMAREAVKAVGRIALQVGCAPGIAGQAVVCASML